MKLQSSKDENRTSFYKILIVLGVLLFLFFIKNIFIAQVVNVVDDFSRYSSMSERLESLSNWKEKKITLRKNINKLEEQLGDNNSFSKGGGESSIGLSVIDSVAKISIVQIEGIKVTKMGKESPFIKLDAQINIYGLYSNINRFVEKIEKQVILINVNQFSIKTSSLYSQKINAELNVELLFKM